MLPAALDRARQGLARAEQQVGAAASELSRVGLPPEASPAERPAAEPAPAEAIPPDRVELSPRAPADPVDAVLTLGAGERLYRANLKVIAIADETLGEAIDVLA